MEKPTAPASANPSKDDVPRHVGNEHVPEHEAAECVDEARHYR
jgi:hypothetical protein